MGRWLIVLFIIVVLVALWYWQRERTREAEERRAAEARRLQSGTRTAPRPSVSATSGASTPRDEGTFQRAAAAATGAGLEQATAQMQEATADLAAARREADLAAARLSAEADATLAAVQAAAAYGGAVPGDGTAGCPSGYPIKGAIPAMLYYEPGHAAYAATTPQVCFQNLAAAGAAGFSAAIVDEPSEAPEVAFAEALARSDGPDGTRSDVVEAAIAAADAGGVPPGAIRGDGSRDCPSAYPIKGNQSSMLYHEPGTPTYASTIPEFCFSSAESAEAAGFSSTRF
jgi:hypothetical protein